MLERLVRIGREGSEVRKSILVMYFWVPTYSISKCVYVCEYMLIAGRLYKSTNC